MKKIVEQIVKLLIYATFFVPLVLVPSSFIFPFIVPKILILRSLILAMLGGYVILLLINWEEYRPRFTALTIALLVFLFSFAISTFVGVDAYHSFWDNHERMLGLFTILHYGIYYIICSAIFKNWTEWKWALRIFLLAGSIVMFIGMLQVGNRDLLLNQGSDRIASTLGNAIYVGGYGLFLFFVALLLVLKEKILVWRFSAFILGILSFFGLLYSGTRGSVIGLLVGIAAVVVGYAMVSNDHPQLRRGLRIIMVLGVLLVGLLYAYRQNPIVSKIPTVGRLLSTSFSGGGVNARFIAWNIAVEGWKARPIFGWGPNNFFYTFNQHYNPRSLELGYGETWFDNAHNIILNTLAVQGAVGLLAYLGIFAMAIMSIIIAYRNKHVEKHVAVVGAAFLVAHLIQNITVFENPTSYLYFMFWLALVNRLSVAKPGDSGDLVVAPGASERVKVPDKAVNSLMIGAVVAVVSFNIFVFNLQPARANMKTLSAMNDLARDPILGLLTVSETLQFNSPHIDDIRSDLSRMIIQIVGERYNKLSREQNNQLLNTARVALDENVKLHPPDIRLYMMLGQLSQLGFVVNNDPRYLLDAERNLETALTYSPRRQQLLYMLSTMKAQLNKKDEAIRLIEQTIADDPKVSESYWRLAYTYHVFGKGDKAREAIDLAKQRNIVFDGQGQQVEALIMAIPAKSTKK